MRFQRWDLLFHKRHFLKFSLTVKNSGRPPPFLLSNRMTSVHLMKMSHEDLCFSQQRAAAAVPRASLGQEEQSGPEEGKEVAGVRKEDNRLEDWQTESGGTESHQAGHLENLNTIIWQNHWFADKTASLALRLCWNSAGQKYRPCRATFNKEKQQAEI